MVAEDISVSERFTQCAMNGFKKKKKKGYRHESNRPANTLIFGENSFFAAIVRRAGLQIQRPTSSASELKEHISSVQTERSSR